MTLQRDPSFSYLIHTRQLSDQRLLVSLRDFAATSPTLLSRPSFDAWPARPCSAATIAKRFDGWLPALRRAGIQIPTPDHSPEALITSLRAAWRDKGSVPAPADLRARGHSLAPYRRHWGTLHKACTALSLFERAEISANELLNPPPPPPPRQTIRPGVRWFILTRDRHRCQSCGTPSAIAPLEVDHILPVARGGSNNPNNLRALCSRCNRGRGASRHLTARPVPPVRRLRVWRAFRLLLTLMLIAAVIVTAPTPDATRCAMASPLDPWPGGPSLVARGAALRNPLVSVSCLGSRPLGPTQHHGQRQFAASAPLLTIPHQPPLHFPPAADRRISEAPAVPFTPKTNFPILTKRIPTFPFGKESDRHVVGYDEYVKTGGYAGLKKALAMKPDEVTEEVKKSQLRGRGGAGFPCGLKWTFLPKLQPGQDPGQRYLAVNADESEPGTFKDRLLMDFDPHLMLEGIAIACYACRIRTAFIFIRGEYHHQTHVVEEAIKEAYAKGIFGKQGLMNGASTGDGAAWAVECHVHRGAGAYICGEETGLLEAIEGKRGWPRIKPPFPAIKGLFGKPTIINNVETLSHVPSIIENGWEWFSKQGTDSKVGGPPSWGTKLMGVSGHVNRPGVFECDLGVKLSTLVNDYCGGMRGGKKFKGAIAGGISMGILGPDQFDAELDFDIGRRYNVLGLGTACPTVFDEDTDMVAVARNIARFFKHESCGQCTPCREGSGWLYQLMCRIEEGNARTKDLDLALEIATSMGTMPGTTICGLADGNNWAVRTIMNKYRDEFEKRVKPSLVQVKVTVGAGAKG